MGAPAPTRRACQTTQGFGVATRSTVDCRKLDPTAIVAFHQADIGEYLRSEDTLT